MASRGKPFWHAEAYGGPLWLQPNVLGKPRDEGRICYPEDIRYWNLTSYMHGARGTLYLRWRPLLDGPLFGAFGPYGMDGSRTSRSQMSKEIGEWIQADAQRPLRASRPVKGEVGILFYPEGQLFTFAQQRDTNLYGDCYEGAYRGFFDNNIQADFVHIDDIDAWDFLYLPYPVMMPGETAERLIRWVDAGGVLVSEGCPGYWGDRGHVGEHQPNLGLDELFGAEQSYVEFTPDILDDLQLNVLGERTFGGGFLQTYTPTTGRAVGWYADPAVNRSIRALEDDPTGAEPHVDRPGRDRPERDAPPIAAVENRFGGGRTLLIGTMPGRGYMVHGGRREFFRRLFSFGRDVQYVTVSDPRIRARMHDGPGGTYLWVANHTRAPVPVSVVVGYGSPPSVVQTVRGPDASIREGTIILTVPARDVTVLRLHGAAAARA